MTPRLGVRAVLTTGLTATSTALMSDVARELAPRRAPDLRRLGVVIAAGFGGFTVLTRPEGPHELADLNPINDNTNKGVSDGIHLLQIGPQRR
jgi:hypothetical protein